MKNKYCVSSIAVLQRCNNTDIHHYLDMIDAHSEQEARCIRLEWLEEHHPTLKYGIVVREIK